MDCLLIELRSQFCGGTMWAGIFPGEQGHERVVGGIHSDETMPEGIGSYGADLPCQGTGSCKRLIYRLSDRFDEQVRVNRDLAFIRRGNFIRLRCPHMRHGSPASIADPRSYTGTTTLKR